jgi:hypothetical protein
MAAQRRIQKRRLIDRDQSREIADEPQNESSGTERKEWGIKPELGATETQLPNMRQERRNSVMTHNAVRVPDNPVHELYDIRHNDVESPGNPIYELHDTRAS